MGKIEINNNLIIDKNYWNGKYFETVPIKLLAIPNSGFSFSHWTDEYNSLSENINLLSTELNLDIKTANRLKAHFIVAPLGIEEEKINFNLYPNPLSNKINIHFDINSKTHVDIKIYNLNGKEIIKLTNKKYEPGKYIINKNLNQLKNGNYILKFKTKSGIEINRKIVKD
jgi:hypothetical protein